MPDQVRHDKSVSSAVDYYPLPPYGAVPPLSGGELLYSVLSLQESVFRFQKSGPGYGNRSFGQGLRGSGCRIRSGMTWCPRRLIITPSSLRDTPPSQGESYWRRATVSNNHPGLWPPLLVKEGSYWRGVYSRTLMFSWRMRRFSCAASSGRICLYKARASSFRPMRARAVAMLER